MRDLIVTTPKSQSKIAEEEAQNCINAGGGKYFRNFKSKPKNLEVGSRIYYVEDGYIRGFGTVSEIFIGKMKCDTTGKEWENNYNAIIPANSWKWIKPIKMKGFQGYLNCEIPREKIEVVGGWKDPKPVAESLINLPTYEEFKI